MTEPTDHELAAWAFLLDTLTPEQLKRLLLIRLGEPYELKSSSKKVKMAKPE